MAKTPDQKKADKLIKQLGAVGITNDGSTVDGIEALKGTETTDELQALVDKVAHAKAEKNSTIFTFKNGDTRTFSQSVHGDEWEERADEFAETNKNTIALRDGEAVK